VIFEVSNQTTFYVVFFFLKEKKQTGKVHRWLHVTTTLQCLFSKEKQNSKKPRIKQVTINEVFGGRS